MSSLNDPQRLVEVVAHEMFREATRRPQSPAAGRPAAHGMAVDHAVEVEDPIEPVRVTRAKQRFRVARPLAGCPAT